MGQSTKANCRCGYTCHAVFGGTRYATLDQMRFPHYCSECGVVNANPYQKLSECPKCHAAPLHRYGVKTTHKPNYFLGIRLRFLEKTTLDWDSFVTNPVGEACFQCAEFSVTVGDHLCPDCGEMRLKFDDQSLCFFD